MFRTVTSNPLLTTQGRYVVLSQEKVEDLKTRRLVIIDSDSLETVFKAEGEDAKDKLSAEIVRLQIEHNSEDPDSIEALMKKTLQPAAEPA